MTKQPAQPEQNVQHGVPIGDGISDSETSGEGVVATGDRREEVHYARREGGELRADHLKRPDGNGQGGGRRGRPRCAGGGRGRGA